MLPYCQRMCKVGTPHLNRRSTFLRQLWIAMTAVTRPDLHRDPTGPRLDEYTGA